MSKSTAVIIVALVGVLVVFGYIYFAMNKNEGVKESANSTNTQTTQTKEVKTTPAKEESKADTTTKTETATNSGLKVEVLKEGTGDRVTKSGDGLSVHYTGTLADGTKFDSSLDRGQPFKFDLGAGQVIKGWDQGLVGLKKGSKVKLTIPPELGYGSQAVGGKIPANSTLIFEVEIMDIL